jgi:hypothetical protein
VDAPVFERSPRLPSPLGQFLYTIPTFKSLSLADRLSLWRLIYSVVDYESDYDKYDRMSVHDLFTTNGVKPQALNPTPSALDLVTQTPKP